MFDLPETETETPQSQTEPTQTAGSVFAPPNPSGQQTEQDEQAPTTTNQELLFGETDEKLTDEERTKRESYKKKFQELYNQITKGLAERHIVNPELAQEITETVISKVILSTDLYEGDPNDPIMCFDQETLYISPEFFNGTSTIENIDTEYTLQHEISHGLIHSGMIYESNELTQYLDHAANLNSGETIDSSSLPPEFAYSLETIRAGLQDPKAASGETYHIQGLISRFSGEKNDEGKTQMELLYEKYLAKGITKPDSYEQFQNHQLKQIAEELITDRLACYLASDGTKSDYWSKFLSKINCKESDAIITQFEAGNVAPELIPQLQELLANQEITNEQKYQSFKASASLDQTGKINSYLDSHEACFYKFKKLAGINKEQFDSLLGDENQIDQGMPYYESEFGFGTNSSGGEGYGGGGGKTAFEQVWTFLFEGQTPKL
ncbi:MAG: hypothetical protein WCW17_01420 [Patescibacteria group bacterium]|jgi:hypothetical protein